jgi:hypothetical protein
LGSQEETSESSSPSNRSPSEHSRSPSPPPRRIRQKYHCVRGELKRAKKELRLLRRETKKQRLTIGAISQHMSDKEHSLHDTPQDARTSSLELGCLIENTKFRKDQLQPSKVPIYRAGPEPRMCLQAGDTLSLKAGHPKVDPIPQHGHRTRQKDPTQDRAQANFVGNPNCSLDVRAVPNILGTLLPRPMSISESPTVQPENAPGSQQSATSQS